MAGTVFSKFFWQDWRGDVQLQRCTFAAKGLWMDLLSIAAQASPPGHVKLGSRAPTIDELATHLRAPVHVVAALIDELKRNEVCDVTREGVLVSRRLVRDFRRRQISVAGGKNRQKQISDAQGQIPVGTRQTSQPPSATNQNPSAISHKPDGSSKDSFQETSDKFGQLQKALGRTIGAHEAFRWLESVFNLEGDGFDFKLDILPTIETMRTEGKVPRDVSTAAYFRKPMLARKLARDAEAAEVERRKAIVRTDQEWAAIVLRFCQSGLWWDTVNKADPGPTPLQAGCQVPPDILEKARTLWNQNGQHPQNSPGEDDWAPGRRVDSVKQATPFFGDNLVVFPKRAAQ